MKDQSESFKSLNIFSLKVTLVKDTFSPFCTFCTMDYTDVTQK